MIEIKMVDISAETFGKYQFCTMHDGLWYSDGDFGGFGTPKWGAVPAPGGAHRMPYRGKLVGLVRKFVGAKSAGPNEK